jgi:hypothetical protein
VLVEPLDDGAELVLVGRGDHDARVRLVVLLHAERQLDDLVSGSQRDDLVERLRQRERVDDVALEDDCLRGHVGSAP